MSLWAYSLFLFVTLATSLALPQPEAPTTLVATAALGVAQEERLDLIDKIFELSLWPAVCGSSASSLPADASRTKALWVEDGIGAIFRNMVKVSQAGGWYTDKNTQVRNIQDLVLHEAGNEGVGECKEITDPACSASGLSYELCKEHPSAHFIWIALTNWANFLAKVHQTFIASTLSITTLTSTLVFEFFTPQENPSGLLVPLGIINGIGGFLATLYGPLGAIPGIGTIIGAIITQAGLNAANPLIQWAAVQSVIGASFKAVTIAHEWLFNTTLKSIPYDSTTPYDTDPIMVPSILFDGTFAEDVEVSVFNNGVYGSLAASGINALWANDGVFILKISDTAYGKGDGEACKAYFNQTVCLDGVAHIWLRWKFGDANELQYATLDPSSWDVRGAYFTAGGNENRLSNYSLDLTMLTVSAVKTFDKYGFPFQNQDQATIDFLKTNPTDLKVADLLYFSIPVCDIDSVLMGKHLNDGEGTEYVNGIQAWGACTCVQQPSWPITNATYADSGGAYVSGDCSGMGWGV